ncbi:class I SAM-dependent methyltransferase [Peribacillus saganii]|uniref:Class I SAM-dependent methyltransferase n=1 Tax=Peribacillus saganii TaxID=2303992 RepID=A0A372LJ77_9BACI|nr:class I SAM-dependent methyltransferase [Peribacillus saganii]RFU66410.1 class I SAM-dependent methyltransferase [Peribacillus saganii]
MLEAFAKQFCKPEGMLGKLAGKIMAVENRKINRWTLGRLGIMPGDYVLEIGFGPGFSLEEICRKEKNVMVDGVDVSDTMVETAAKRNEAAIENGDLRLYKGDVFTLKQQCHQYDKVLSVNNYPLWEKHEESLTRIHQLMKDGGRIAITVQPREEDATPEKTMALGIKIEQDLFNAGFRDISVKFKKVRPMLTVCVTAECKKQDIQTH